MALLQHELQHVLEFASGELTVRGYLLSPRNWRYDYEIAGTSVWRRFGAEQRARMAEDLWRAEHGLMAADVDALRRLIPWA